MSSSSTGEVLRLRAARGKVVASDVEDFSLGVLQRLHAGVNPAQKASVKLPQNPLQALTHGSTTSVIPHVELPRKACHLCRACPVIQLAAHLARHVTLGDGECLAFGRQVRSDGGEVVRGRRTR